MAADPVEANRPAWRSLPFFNSSSFDTSSNPIFAGGTSNSIHTIRALDLYPPGVSLDVDKTDDQAVAESSARASSSSSKATRNVPCQDGPYLLALRSGDLSLLHPSELIPLTVPFQCIRSGTITHVEYDAASGRVVVLSEDQGGAGYPMLRIWDLKTNLASLKSRRGERSDDGKWQWRPRLLAETRVQHGKKPFPIAAMAVTPRLGYLACSLSSGAVLLLRNLAAVLDSAPIATTSVQAAAAVNLPKFKVVYQPGAEAAWGKGSAPQLQEPVTTLGFSFGSTAKSEKTLNLFIATISKVMKYTVLGKGAGNTPVTLDDIGSPLGCSTLLPPSGIAEETGAGTAGEAKLLIAQPEALYTIGSSGREDCYAFEGDKVKVQLLPTSRQLVILAPPTINPSSSSDRRALNRVQDEKESTKVNIFDLDGKFLSYSGVVSGAVQTVFTDATAVSSKAGLAVSSVSTGREDVYLLTTNGSLHRLQEKPLQEKLDLLYQRSLYLLSVQVAKSHFARTTVVADGGQDREAVTRLNALLAEIWIKYGDHLYEKGDYEGSMKMGYLKSVAAAASMTAGRSKSKRTKAAAGLGESYIIRKFLDAQRIPLLTLYLQELHRRGVANRDHTTLLLNCYTKLKDTEALDRFIRRTHTTSGEENGFASDDDHAESLELQQDGDELDGLPFDLTTAIKVCRSANYFAQAAYLARRFNLGEEYLRIKIEDTNAPLEALEWLRTREAEEVIRHLKLYAGLLLSPDRPDSEAAQRETTDLLIELCSGAYQPRLANSADAIGQAAKAAQQSGADHARGKGYLSYLTGGGEPAAQVKPYEINGSTANGHDAGKAASEANDTTPADDSPPKAPYAIPSARQFFPHFIPHPRAFRRFLETIALARWDQAVADGEEEYDDEGRLAVLPAYEDDDGDDDDEDLQEQKSIWNTLLELYLHSPGSKQEQQSTMANGNTSDSDHDRELAVRILKQYQRLPHDIHHALVLCEQEDFTQGIVTLYERLGMYEDILTIWMDRAKEQLPSEKTSVNGDRKVLNGDNDEHSSPSHQLLIALDRYGSLDSSLYTSVLTFLISHPLLLSRHRPEVVEILHHIKEEKLMSTLQLVQLLSESEYANVGLVKEFLEASVREEKDEMEAVSGTIKQERTRTLLTTHFVPFFRINVS